MKNIEYGYALGGGGARAYFQIGAIAALEKEKINPTYICGTSMGAVNAILLAIGMNSDELYKFYNTNHVIKMFSPSIGLKHLLSNENLGKLIKYMCNSLGYKNIEDLPIKTAICVTDNKTNKVVFLTKGDICEAVMASSATSMTKKIKITDETIKKQVCEQTGQEYIEGMKIVLKDGCYTANVPFDGLDFIRQEKENTEFYDICFDVVPLCKKINIDAIDSFIFRFTIMIEHVKKDLKIQIRAVIWNLKNL